MDATLYLVGPWPGDTSLESEVAAGLGRIGLALCEPPGETSAEAAGILRVRAVGPERWLEADERLTHELLKRPSVCAFELSVRTGQPATLVRVHLEGTALVRGQVTELALPNGIDQEDLADVACDVALAVAADGPVTSGAAGSRHLFFRAG